MSFFRKNPIRYRYVSLNELTADDIQNMHALFVDYYEHADFKTFYRDLQEKNGSLVCREKQTGKIVAFSNIQLLKTSFKGKTIHAIFTGDTVSDRRFWKKNRGRNPLHSAFYYFVLHFKLKHCFRKTYWFMISMSFRTYLLIANNMMHYYPHYRKNDAKTLKLKLICHHLAREMYGSRFDEQTGWVDFGRGETNQTIKKDVAPLTTDMLSQYPKIAFYHKLNPNAHKGIEIACIGEISSSVMLLYTWKYLQIFIKFVASLVRRKIFVPNS